MKNKDIILRFLLPLVLIFCMYLVVVVYWIQHTNHNTPKSFQAQKNRTLTDKRPLIQCNEGHYYSQMDNSCLACENGSFSLHGWIRCLSWLNCGRIGRDVRTRRRLGKLNGVKHIFLADWHGYEIVYMKCAHEMFWEDCVNDRKMLQAFQGSDLVVELIGSCDQKQEIITTFYRHGSADKLLNLLSQLKLTEQQEFDVQKQLAKDYVRILHFLHNSPLGVRVMCDTNSLRKTLSQFLVTDGLRLVVNDLDALPEVDHSAGKLVKCGHRELFGSFVAPEQLWPFNNETFSDTRMHGYDEKIDIWRIPNVVKWFLGDRLGGLKIKMRLRALFSRCKSSNPKDRPTAEQVLKELEKSI